jgi:GNAT superfamily N-acetyltransferase
LSSIDVSPVRSRRDLMRFIRLPWRIYRNSPQWVPPLIFERKQFLSRKKNPWFKHGDMELFLAWRGGTPVGRISAQYDEDFNAEHGHRWGMFGFFECENDPEAARALVDAARGWLEERGYDRMVGPFDNTMNDEAGVLIEGFEHKPMVKQPWQHPYYQDLLEGAGMSKAIDLYMWTLQVDKRSDVAPMIWQVAEQAEKEHGITLRHMRKKRIQDEVKAFVEIYNAAWKRNWGFTPMREEDFAHAAKEMKPLLSEDWIMACEDRDGRTIAVALTVPDFNQAIGRANGRLLPFGWARLLWKLPRIDQVRVGFLGVLPEYQHTGVAALLYREHFDMAEKTPQSGGEMGWILENNKPMNRAMEGMGGKIAKKYRVYEQVLRPGE